MRRLFPKRFSLLWFYVGVFLLLSAIVRTSLLIWNFNEVDTSFFEVGNTYIIGFFFDLGTVSFFAIPYVFYLLLWPAKWNGSYIDKIITYIGYSLGLIIFLFSFFAEFTFWEEFRRRFNFIAVDYLIYTNEVVQNINESYPIPLLFLGILSLSFFILFITKRRAVFKTTLGSNSTFRARLIPSIFIVCIAVIFGLFIPNRDAEFSENRYNNELAKSGIYSFFAAFRNNELRYREFYRTIDNEVAFSEVKKSLLKNKSRSLSSDKSPIYRKIVSEDSLPSLRPNVILIFIESLSAKFMNSFGNDQNLTPKLDSLAHESLFFTNLFATGTRTVRGMEALTLSIPPTPGRSIVKRENNTDLFTIGTIFKEHGYVRNFFYGGDGYFDNMNTYFGGNGFNIIDRGRGFLLDKGIEPMRYNIEDEEVTFENAWGVADADIYRKVLKEADKSFIKDELFFNFVMTSSNHRPYTYPEGKVEIPSGANGEGAIQYTDFAIGEFLEEAKTKPWYKNTVFVILSDHCASSAGRQELDVANYHIPGLILNAPNVEPQKVTKMASQIDVFPTLFSILNWEYNSNFFGKDILGFSPSDERAFIGNYRNLGLLKGDKLMVLGDQMKANFYKWNRNSNELNVQKMDTIFLTETISYYQLADYLFNNKGLKTKTLGIND